MKNKDEFKKMIIREMIIKDLVSFQLKETARITEKVVIRKMVQDRKLKKIKSKDKK